MSLKAKIEAVIYASEEPVTLTQLVGLLGEEAQAELDREAADQRALLKEEELEAAEEVPVLGEDFDSVGGDGDGEAVLAAAASPPPEDEETVLDGAPDSVELTQDDETVLVGAPAAAKAEKARAVRLQTYFRTVLDELVAEYSSAARGLEIREVAGGFRFGTKPE